VTGAEDKLLTISTHNSDTAFDVRRNRLKNYLMKNSK